MSVRVMVYVIVLPTLGVGLLTVLDRARLACCGVTMAVAVLLLVLGSDWLAAVITAEFDCELGLTTRAEITSVCGVAVVTIPHGPQAAGRVVGALAGGCREEGQAERKQVGDLHAGRRGGAVVGQVERVSDGVTDVGSRVADGLGERQVGQGVDE